MPLPPYIPVSDPSDNQGPAIIYTTWFLIGLSTVVIAARIWCKISRTGRLYYDDGIMIFALLFGLVHAALITVAVDYGLGRHFADLLPNQRRGSLYYGFLTLAWGNLSPMAGRVAFCVTMLFLTRTDQWVTRWPIWVFIAGQILLNASSVVFFYSQCGTHLHSMMTADFIAMASYCLNPVYQTDYGYFVGAFNCLTDVFLTVLPLILIQRTRMSFKRQAGLALLLCLSVLALVAAIVKTYEAKALSEVTDYTYDLCIYVIMVSVELNVVIIVATVPLLRPLFRRTVPYEMQPSHAPDTFTLDSLSRDKLHHVQISRQSQSSEENIMSRDDEAEPEGLAGIHVTREVIISYQPTNVPFVHATLVGLIHGEIANPWLVK